MGPPSATTSPATRQRRPALPPRPPPVLAGSTGLDSPGLDSPGLDTIRLHSASGNVELWAGEIRSGDLQVVAERGPGGRALAHVCLFRAIFGLQGFRTAGQAAAGAPPTRSARVIPGIQRLAARTPAQRRPGFFLRGFPGDDLVLGSGAVGGRTRWPFRTPEEPAAAAPATSEPFEPLEPPDPVGPGEPEPSPGEESDDELFPAAESGRLTGEG